jgi:hypothetical protein
MRRLLPYLLLCIGTSASADPKARTLRYRSVFSTRLPLSGKQLPERVVTYELVIDGAAATLTIVERGRRLGEADWKPISDRQLEGSITTQRSGAFSLDLATKEGDTMKTLCKPESLRVAKATATLRRKPNAGECEATPVWSPSTLTPTKVYTCKLAVRDDQDPVIPASLSLAEGPGVEAVAVNDDCSLQGSGFRRALYGDTVTPVRTK